MVKSTTTSAPRSASELTSPTMVRPAASPPTWAGSIAATSSRSAAPSMARQTSWPMRPPAPTTPTLIMGSRLPGGHGREVGLEALGIEGAHWAHGGGGLRQLGRDVEDLGPVDRVDGRQHLVDRQHLAVQQQRPAD